MFLWKLWTNLHFCGEEIVYKNCKMVPRGSCNLSTISWYIFGLEILPNKLFTRKRKKKYKIVTNGVFGKNCLPLFVQVKRTNYTIWQNKLYCMPFPIKCLHYVCTKKIVLHCYIWFMYKHI